MLAVFAVLRMLLLLALLVSATAYPDTLVQTNILYRHGDRAPIDKYPTDKHNESEWRYGFGHLTEVGRVQQLNLGKFLRRTYHGFIKETYDHNEVYVRSSDKDRCLLSAYSNLAGLYGNKNTVWDNEYIMWNPLPVHSAPEELDDLLAMHRPCKIASDERLRLLTKSQTAVQLTNDYKEFFHWLSAETGVSLGTEDAFLNMWQISDTLFCEKTHGLTTPPWANWTNVTCAHSTIVPCDGKSVFDILRDMQDKQFTVMYNSSIMHKFDGGPLMEEIVHNFEMYPVNKTKLYMYSAHDSTVAALLSALGIFNGLSPEYTATVILELHTIPDNPNKYQVKLHYKNVTDDDTFYNLTIKGCPDVCTLEKFKAIASKIFFVIKDWDKECKNDNKPNPVNPSDQFKITQSDFVIIIVCCTIVASLGILTLLCHIRRRRISQSYVQLSQHS